MCVHLIYILFLWFMLIKILLIYFFLVNTN